MRPRTSSASSHSGSQLGSPAMIQRLDTTRTSRPYNYPQHVDSWMNLHDYEDFIGFSAAADGVPLFDPGGTTWRRPPVDYAINNGSAYHHLIGAYLAHHYVARAIASAWCDAVKASGQLAQTGCGAGSPRDLAFERDELRSESAAKNGSTSRSSPSSQPVALC